jgi:tripartite-type tricarboxylate transporter receptor subunit TctC
MSQVRHSIRARSLVRAIVIAAGAVAAGLAIAGASSDVALAQASYPSKPVRIVVGFAAGGPTDIIARVLGAKLSDLLGQQVVIENRAGASGNLATEAVARAANDGYTLLMTPLANAVNESLFKNLRYRFDEHFVPIAPVADTANVLIVHPSLDAKSVPDLIALDKAKPGYIFYATAGRGTATHLAGELFNFMAGTKLVAVHYKGGGETIKDLVSGQVKVMFSTIPPVLGFVKDGTLRGLATTGVKRDAALPELPTIAEAGLANFDLRLWFGLAAPAGTPMSVVDRVSDATSQALKSPEMKTALAAQGFEPMIGTAQQFGDLYRREAAKWAKVVTTVGLSSE